MTIIDFLATRRSVKPEMLHDPGPSADELDRILSIAARVPDHKKLAPWRFIVFTGPARAAIGAVIVEALEKAEKEPPSETRRAFEQGRLLRAPVVIAVVSRAADRPGVPAWEQILSAGAVCFNACLAANALGFATSWITEWIAYDPHVRAALRLAANERIAGFIYIGTAKETPPDRERPDLKSLVTYWTAED